MNKGFYNIPKNRTYVAPSNSTSASYSTNVFGGTDGYIPIWSGSSALSSSAFYQSSDSIAFGTQTPHGKFHIDLDNSNYATANGDYSHITLNNPNAGAQTMLSFTTNGVLTGKIRNDYVGGMTYASIGSSNYHIFFTNGDYSIGDGKLLLRNNGNIYIGDGAQNSSDSGYRLDVSGSVRFISGLTVTGSIISTGGFTGSLQGTASWANNALTASYLNSLTQSVNITGSVTASIFAATSNGNGTNFKVGDDAWIGDINVADTIGIKGQFSPTKGYIKFGSGSSNPVLGANNSSTLSLTGTLDASGPINVKFVQGVLSADQSINNSSDTIIQFVDQYDTNNWLTSNQFKPTIAGYYEVYANVLLESPGVSNNQANVQFRFNGNTYALLQQVLNAYTNQTINGSKIIYFNGSTDYVDFTIYHGSGVTKKILQGANYQGTWFTAKLLSS